MKNDFLFILDLDESSKDLSKNREGSRISPVFHLYISDLGLTLDEADNDRDNGCLLSNISEILARDISKQLECSDHSKEYSEALINSLLSKKIYCEYDFYEQEYVDSFEEKTFIVVDFDKNRMFSLSSDVNGNYKPVEIHDKDFIDEVVKNTEIYKHIDPERGFECQFSALAPSFNRK